MKCALFEEECIANLHCHSRPQVPPAQETVAHAAPSQGRVPLQRERAPSPPPSSPAATKYLASTRSWGAGAVGLHPHANGMGAAMPVSVGAPMGMMHPGHHMQQHHRAPSSSSGSAVSFQAPPPAIRDLVLEFGEWTPPPWIPWLAARAGEQEPGRPPARAAAAGAARMAAAASRAARTIIMSSMGASSSNSNSRSWWGGRGYMGIREKVSERPSRSWVGKS